MPPGRSPDSADVPVGPRDSDLIAAAAVFGQQLPLAQRYAALLLGPGIERGLLGPREAETLWSRHLLNCAVVAELLPAGAQVSDVGSGAGLPGLALACARPDLTVRLIEPLLRRAEFLIEAVGELGLSGRVAVIRGRAEDAAVRAAVAPARWITARAVAPLDRLTGWCLPLLGTGGALLAIKGARADEEVAAHRATIATLGGSIPDVVCCGTGKVEQPTRVVVIQRSRVTRRGRHD